MTPELVELPSSSDIFLSSMVNTGSIQCPSGRYTVDGSEQLEEWLAGFCERIRRDVQVLVPARRLDALLLGGGYGRGEGGVLHADGVERPYNDLDIYVCLRGSHLLFGRSYQTALDTLGHMLSVEGGIEVEFKVMSLARLRREPVSMFTYDLVAGHRWLLGDETLLKDCESHRQGENIPLAEATRLLMNRCSGLLFARERLQREDFTPECADFASRNIAKAQLAYGDVVLAAHRQYHFSCRERHRRLLRLEPQETLPWLSEVRRYHARGVQFKLRPTRPTTMRGELDTLLGEVTALGREVWLWSETRRLNHGFTSARDYALSQVNKCPETRPWRNSLVTLLRLGPKVWLKERATSYPRERLLHALPLLLWDSAHRTESHLLQAVQSELNTTATEPASLIRAYESLWRHFR